MNVRTCTRARSRQRCPSFPGFRLWITGRNPGPKPRDRRPEHSREGLRGADLRRRRSGPDGQTNQSLDSVWYGRRARPDGDTATPGVAGSGAARSPITCSRDATRQLHEVTGRVSALCVTTPAASATPARSTPAACDQSSARLKVHTRPYPTAPVAGLPKPGQVVRASPTTVRGYRRLERPFPLQDHSPISLLRDGRQTGGDAPPQSSARPACGGPGRRSQSSPYSAAWVAAEPTPEPSQQSPGGRHTCGAAKVITRVETASGGPCGGRACPGGRGSL